MPNEIKGLPSNPLGIRYALLEKGYEPIACAGKVPVSMGWQSMPVSTGSVKGESKNFPTARNTGVRTGRVIGLDLDIETAEHLEEFKILLSRSGIEKSSFIRIGQAPKELHVFRLPDGVELKKMQSTFFETDDDDAPKFGIEILLKGQQFIAHGKHPDTGNDYHWPYQDIINSHVSDLPVLTPDALTEIMSLFEQYSTEQEFVQKLRTGTTTAEKWTPPNQDPPGTLYNQDDAIFDVLREHYNPRAVNKRPGWYKVDCFEMGRHDKGKNDGSYYKKIGVAPDGEIREAVYRCHHESHGVLRTNQLYKYMMKKHGVRNSDFVDPFANISFSQSGEKLDDSLSWSQFRTEFASGTYLLEDMLRLGGVSQIFGAGGSMKTFIAQSIAMHLSRGMDWFSQRILDDKGHNVLYVASEAHGQIARRGRAWEKTLTTLNSGERFRVTPGPLDICYEKGGASPLMDEIERLIENEFSDQGLGLLVIDPLADCLGDVDENSNTGMRSIMRTLKHIAAQYKCAVLIVHHSGRSAKADHGRGASSVDWGTETIFKAELEATEPGNADTYVLDLGQRRSRDHWAGNFKFAFDFVNLGDVDQWGRPSRDELVMVLPTREQKFAADKAKDTKEKAEKESLKGNRAKLYKAACITAGFGTIGLATAHMGSFMNDTKVPLSFDALRPRARECGLKTQYLKRDVRKMAPLIHFTDDSEMMIELVLKREHLEVLK